jgi:hypothetical protein
MAPGDVAPVRVYVTLSKYAAPHRAPYQQVYGGVHPPAAGGHRGCPSPADGGRLPSSDSGVGIGPTTTASIAWARRILSAAEGPWLDGASAENGTCRGHKDAPTLLQQLGAWQP